jgi:hypothetical protein
MRALGLIAALIAALIADSEAAKLISCPSTAGQTCTVSMVSISGTTPTTIWTDQSLTEIADPGGHGQSDYIRQYGSDLDPALEYRVFCNCSTSGSWVYAYEPFETRVDGTLTSRASWNDTIDNSVTALNFMKFMGAVLAGKSSGGGTGSLTFQQLGGGNTTRVQATVDNKGNRSAVTVTP